jgi:hypothetical protein
LGGDILSSLRDLGWQSGTIPETVNQSPVMEEEK